MEFFPFLSPRLQSHLLFVIMRKTILYPPPCFRLENCYLETDHCMIVIVDLFCSEAITFERKISRNLCLVDSETLTSRGSTPSGMTLMFVPPISKRRKSSKFIKFHISLKNKRLREEITSCLAFSPTMHDSWRHLGWKLLLAVARSLPSFPRQHCDNNGRLGPICSGPETSKTITIDRFHVTSSHSKIQN